MDVPSCSSRSPSRFLGIRCDVDVDTDIVVVEMPPLSWEATLPLRDIVPTPLER